MAVSLERVDQFERRVIVHYPLTVKAPSGYTMVALDDEGYDSRCFICDSRYCFYGCGSGVPGFVFVKGCGWIHEDDLEVVG